MNIIDNLQYHLDRSTPIIAITTPDPVSTITDIADWYKSTETFVFCWDIVSGFTLNERSAAFWTSLGNSLTEATTIPDSEKNAMLLTYNQMGRGGDASSALELCKYFPPNSIVIIKHADVLLEDPKLQQAIMNLRNSFKSNNRSIVLVSSWFTLPICLRNDTVVIDEPLPSRNALRLAAESITESAGLDFTTFNQSMDHIIDCVSGLPYFQAEQALSLAIQRNGFDTTRLIKIKQQLVNQTRGLSVHIQTQDYSTIGGLDGIKQYMRLLMNGPRPPQCILWIDEFDKSGVNYTGDSNGINADLLGTMLSYMEDTNAHGICLHGVPGCGKSALVKATGAEFGRMVIRMDLGAMKGSFVGESEANLRASLRLADALGQGNVLVMATTNSQRGMDSAMKSRFSETFFFNMPTPEELDPIWDIHKRAFGLTDAAKPSKHGWVGRDVKKCCNTSYRLGIPLEQAARSVVPVGVASAQEIATMIQEAKNKYICANTGNIYQ